MRQKIATQLNYAKIVMLQDEGWSLRALGKHYGVSAGEAYSIYQPLKNVLYPNITDEELVEKLFNSQGGLPETTVTQETHKEKAEKMLKDFNRGLNIAREDGILKRLVNKYGLKSRCGYPVICNEGNFSLCHVLYF